MFVIASDSTLTYKGKPVKIKQVSEELGVRYVLEGSAQKSGNRVRVNAQLIDATTGHYLWSEKYDRELQDLFALQDEITHNIIVELQVKLTEGEQARVSQKSTTNLEAWSYANRGLAIWMRISKENNAKAMELFEKAVELDPNYVWAWVRLAWTHSMAAEPGWSQNPSEHFKMFLEISKKVLAMDESNSDVHALLGLAYLLQREPEKAIAEGEKALVLGPTNAQAHVLLAVSMNDVGRFDDAIRLVEKAMRLHPYYPAYYLSWLGGGYRMTGRYEDALTVYNQLLGRSQKGEFPVVNAHLYLVDLYAEIGKEEEARAHAAEIFKIEPGFSLKSIRGISSYDYIDPALLERRLKALRKAGIPEHPPLPLPDKPSIAVLAFDNMSGDPAQEHFSDGITEEIISTLSKTNALFVIARNSSFVYKSKPVNVKQISRELGVRYVLEGSVRKSGDRVRITAQLIDATTGHHLWSERYDRDLKDIFALQDEISLKIVTALEIKLTEGEQARMWGKHYKTLDVFLKRMETHSLWREGTVESHMRHAQVSQEIIDMAPESPRGYMSLGYHYWWLSFIGKSPRENIKKSFELAQTAISKDEFDPASHELLASVYLSMRQYDKAIATGQRAIELEPNGADVYAKLGQTLSFAGRPDEAIEYIKKGIRLNPFPEPFYFYDLGRCYTLKGEYEKALTEYKKALQRAPKAPWPHMYLATAYSLLDRQEEARASAEKCLELAPFVSVGWITKISLFKNEADLELIIDAMRKAGFPEGA
jgi:TolB-like protein/Tfp pilus assembly protein PilF